MALFDLAGTATGLATVDGSLSVLVALGESVSGGSSAALAGPNLIHDIVDPLSGSSSVSASAETIINVSGYVVGSGLALDTSLKDLAGMAIGSSVVTADAQRILGVSGYIQGSSAVNLVYPLPIVGVAVVTAYMEVNRVARPICDPVPVQSFRWGHTFTVGDLAFRTADSRGPFGPVCITYTLYQVQPGCALKQIGPSGRKPGQRGVGCYYVTGTAGECGQPGLWAVRWRYQRTYSHPVVETDCYFQVVDSVSCPIPGDTLERHCKYGWD